LSEARRRLLLAAFGDPGHAFPMLALGRELAARGHEVTLETWERWREPVEADGMAFAPAPEYPVFPTRERPLKPYEAAVRAARVTRELVRCVRPDAVVADIITAAPTLAAELEGVAVATLIPHVFPPEAPAAPPYSLGARPARTRAGRALWRALRRPAAGGYRRGREELNEARHRLGLPPLAHVHGGISRRLALVATFPQLEYPRSWPQSVRVIGPLLWEPPAQAEAPPPGEGPVVLVAPSTVQDPDHRLLRAALAGLAREPVRVIAALNRRSPSEPLDVPPNARVVDWLSYSKTMPGCDVVVCNGGHGTLARALSCGCPVVVVPAVGDMNENAARADWAGVGVRLPWRLLGPRTLRLAVRRVLEEPAFRARAREMLTWSEANDAAARAADGVEQLARPSPG
jgi:MGT family glycosyltransferase